ncbi:YqcC family protein [Marinomonas sp. IMCC 4694]|uniref:YqcC family protein n=1 Tax=Marinomonas sp. IMCC 4694 TaxID=2605432 RepID=UPI0011E6C96F|nr:YqcC family protein [Marinomonas sp. IMCC 4694]TYL47525.1 YqcC family protein [Marinomonas sp. IMCC 4694]
MKNPFSDHHILADLLMNLQMALQDAGVWVCDIPSPFAMQSVEPFCIDSMRFEQWLRFVMLERFKVMLSQGQALPNRCHISPMAQDAFKGLPEDKIRAIVRCLDRIDQHLSNDS